MMRLVYIILILSLKLSLLAQAPVDGWNKGKGNLDLVGSFTFETFGQYYAGNDLTPISRASTAISAFGAYGITNWWDVQLNIPFIYTQPKYSGLQDLAFYTKARFVQMNLSNSQLSFLISAGFSAPLMNYPTESLFSIGQQTTAFDGRGIVQWKHNSGWFVMAQSGHTYRMDPVPSSFPFSAKLGLAKAEYFVEAWFDYQNAFGGFDYQDGTNSSFRTFGVSYSKVGASFYKPFKSGKGGWSVMGSYILSGRNVGQTIGVSAAYIRKLKVGK